MLELKCLALLGFSQHGSVLVFNFVSWLRDCYVGICCVSYYHPDPPNIISSVSVVREGGSLLRHM